MRKTALLCVVLAALLLAGLLAQASLARSPLGGGGEAEGEETPTRVDYLEFLGGVRQFFSYVLWARSDAIHHGYYESLERETELIPYYYMISWLDPNYVDSYYVAALTIFKAGREQEAIDFTKQGIAANPDSGDLYVSLGDLYLRQHRYELARDAYREALGKRFELVDETYAVFSIGAASQAIGDLAGAISAKREVLDSYRMLLVRPDLSQPVRDYFVNKVNELTDEIRELEEELAANAGEIGEGDQAGQGPGALSVIFVN